jgi:glycosyltransferase involved in cell wall biosynthesis
MSKRVLVVTSDVPFVEGGHLTIARSTVRALRECGHEADLVLTPQNRFGRQLRAYVANRFTDVGMDGLGRTIDQVISFRFPSFAVHHLQHVCWLNHRMREYYDLWEALCARLSSGDRIKETVRRQIIHALDNHLLKHDVTKVFAQSQTVRERLKTWGNIPSEVLYPPPPQREYRREAAGNFVFSVSRLHSLKRLDLLVEAFRFVRNMDVQARVIGSGPEFEPLQSKIKEYGLDDRVFLLGETDERTLLDNYARCLAVFFCPLNEDYGLVTSEAFASGKPVITARDSGGPAELVRHGETGFIVEPTPREIALRIDQLSENKALAEKMGQAAFDFVSGMTWDKAVQKLLLP